MCGNFIESKLFVLNGKDVMWEGKSSIHSCTPPFTKISEEEIRSSEGIHIRLIPGVSEFIRKAHAMGNLFALPKYNMEKNTIQALKAFGLLKYFSFPVMQWNKPKKKFQKMLNINGNTRFFEQEEIIFVENTKAINSLFIEYSIEKTDQR